MTTRLPVTFVGSGAASGIYAAPGPTISYTSSAGNMLVAAGYVIAETAGALSAVSGVTSITDTGGNQWAFSASDSQFPPSVYNPAGNGYVTFVACCVAAVPVTAVTFADATGGADTWNVTVAEFTNLSGPVYWSAQSAAPGTAATVTASFTAFSSCETLIAAMYSSGAAITGFSGSSHAFPLEGSLDGPPYAYLVAQSHICTQTGPVYAAVGSGSATVSETSSITVPLATGIACGDLIILDILQSGTTVTEWPDGFMQQISVAGINNPASVRQVATKLATGMEGASVTAGFSDLAVASALTYVLRGAQRAMPANMAVLDGSGYTQVLAAPSLSVADPADAVVYGYGGVLGDVSGTVTIASWPAAVAGNSPAAVSLPGLNGSVQGIGWGVNVSSATAVASAPVDVLDYALDIPVACGCSVMWTWDLSSQADSAVALMAFTPHCMEDTMPPAPAMRSFP